jgi:glycosyltransferase involved in cell wall biosynthesis
MKYPCVLFMRHLKYAAVDKTIAHAETNGLLKCSICITSEPENVRKLFRENCNILVTYGPNKQEYDVVKKIIPERLQNAIWIHIHSLDNIAELNTNVNYYFINHVIGARVHTRPRFSIFTTCFESYEKILRAYESVQMQTFIDWEWIILDDSPEGNHFNYLQKTLCDPRIRLYKRASNSGVIGNVKNEAVSLCRGEYCIELDHDDKLTPTCLEDAVYVFDLKPDVGFIYMDFINMYADGTPMKYNSKIISKGYGGYYAMKYEGVWQYVFITPNINNISLSNLVCCPNHPRIWERQTLIDVGNYSELLPICDDYELLLRTCTKTKIAKICKVGYIQYMNEGENNFSIIRKDEIERLGTMYVGPHYARKHNIHGIMRSIDAYEDPQYESNHSNIWERRHYTHKFSNYRINPDYNTQVLIIGGARLQHKEVCDHINDEKTEVFIIDTNNNISALTSLADKYGYENLRCCSLPTSCGRKEVLQYFDLMCRACDYTIILE